VTGALLFHAVAFPLWVLSLARLAPTVALEDSGEMIRAALALGITHEPGYPLYVFLGRLAVLLPVGCPAFRMNLVSAAAASGAAGLLAVLVRRLLLDSARPACGARTAWWSAVAAGWLLGLAPTLAWESVIAEKYTLSVLWFVVLLAVTVVVADGTRRAGIALAGLALGLAMAHHGQAVYILPGLAVAVWFALRGRPLTGWMRPAILLGFTALLGFSVKLVSIPVRAAAHPWPDWNNPAVFGRWVRYLGGETYHQRLFKWGAWGTSTRLASHAVTVLPDEFGWAAIALAVAGLGWIVSRRRWRDLAWVIPGAAGAVFAAGFGLVTVSLRLYYLPAFAIFAVLAGFGLALVVDRARWPAVRFAVAALAACWIGARAVHEVRTANWSRYYLAHDFARDVLNFAGEGCIVVAHGDYVYFPVSCVREVDRPESGTLVVLANELDPGKRPLQSKRIQLMYPPAESGLAARCPWGEDLMAADLGRPVRFAVVFGGIEREALVTRGIVYEVARGRGDRAPARILADRAWFRKRGRWRGLYDPRMPRDEHTRQLLVRYPYADFWRARLLAVQGRCAEAIPLFRAVLFWPAEWPINRPGIEESIRACGGRAR